MKILKKTILVFILIISFCLININVKAFENTHEITYEFIYTNVVLKAQEQDSNFSFNEYNNFICYSNASSLTCFFFKDTDLENSSLEYKDNKLILNFNKWVNTYKTYTPISLSGINISFPTLSNLSSDLKIYSNILKFKDITNVIYINSGVIEEPDEKPKELEITTTGTEILTSMLDKTKNIYEVLIANQFFVVCLSILLSYLVFIILYKIIKK